MSLSRRGLLGAGLGLAGAAVLGTTAGCADDPAGQTARVFRSDRPLPERFVVPFVVPPVKEGSRREDGSTRYTIIQRTASVEILPGLSTEIYGYDGLLPGDHQGPAGRGGRGHAPQRPAGAHGGAPARRAHPG